ncbi:Legume lectin domain protein [Actinidia chinensis var. chinensis]|uniref:Legume lectin domain protein n=1 Tax=Actinidia chinensis var. chinensis TaxID=1590841 RepID=A0A2R6S326_ACTCC|nr:Legume lectin domain protein [Actinidia chinensis var. chinensis]
MAVFSSISPHSQIQQLQSITSMSFLFLIPCAISVSFNFSVIWMKRQGIYYQGDTGVIQAVNPKSCGDGLAFFLAPFQGEIPTNSVGGYLGLFSNDSVLNSTSNHIVVVEFDTFQNHWDPNSDDRVGINVNSIASVASVMWNSIIKNGTIANAWGNVARVGKCRYSAAIGAWIEIHIILSWSFRSTLEVTKSTDEKKRRLIAGLAAGIGTLSCGLGLFWFIKWRTTALGRKKDTVVDAVISNDFEVGTGSRRFTFRELIWATNNFSEGKLGEGGFGGVYKGLLRDTKVEMPEQGEFLVVYEFMPNGSLDSHLFGGKSKLTLAVRYKIALGLALALPYLHEECEQCVVRRDMKSSNVMLDSNYNAKLGDFGLARLLDNELCTHTIILAGTTGYLTPECVTTGKANRESDTYSFGFVALEITCGRRPVELKWEPSRVRLIDWVWDLYGRGQILEAANKSLTME